MDPWHELAVGLVFQRNPAFVETASGEPVRVRSLEIDGASVLAEVASAHVTAGAELVGRIGNPRHASRWLVKIKVTAVYPFSPTIDRIACVIGEPQPDTTQRRLGRVVTRAGATLTSLHDPTFTVPARVVDLSRTGVGMIVGSASRVAVGGRFRLVVSEMWRLDAVVEVVSVKQRDHHDDRVGGVFVDMPAHERRDLEQRLAGIGDPSG